MKTTVLKARKGSKQTKKKPVQNFAPAILLLIGLYDVKPNDSSISSAETSINGKLRTSKNK